MSWENAVQPTCRKAGIIILGALAVCLAWQTLTRPTNVTVPISATAGPVTTTTVPVKRPSGTLKTMRVTNRIIPKPIASTQPRLPGMLADTSVIGTAQHPTIDGGIIHSTDVQLAEDADVHPTPILPQTAAINAPKTIAPHTAFNDRWAENANLTHLLTTAASGGKLAYVMQTLQVMHLPASVAVVPMVESDYEAHALSPKGAAGAWQLMPGTANAYGLTNTGRFGFGASTDTALRILKQLHQQFGNWDLAYAAYNAGPARVAAALQKNPNATTITTLDLPLETKQYVARLQTLNERLAEWNANGA